MYCQLPTLKLMGDYLLFSCISHYVCALLIMWLERIVPIHVEGQKNGGY